MKIPFKPIYLPKGPRRYRYIILHDTNCMCQEFNDFKNDGMKFQTNLLRERMRQKNKWFELPFHFVCEKIMDDYHTVVARPTQYSCEDCYPNMDSLFRRFGIHICIMGNFNIMVGDTRMYQQICYRAITPVMKQYRIPKSNILLHGEVEPTKLDCPGFNFSKQHLKAYLLPFMVAQHST